MNNSGQGSVVLQDCAAVPLQNLKIFGWSTQDGTASPENPVPIVSAGDGGSIDLTVSNGASLSQSIAISTPNGLPGIPVDSGGNYTDAAGQQWVCDEIDYARGVYVQRTKYARLPGSGYTTDIEISEKRYVITVSQIFGRITNKRHPIITTVAKTLSPITQSVQGQIFQYDSKVYWYCTDYFSSLEELNAFLDENEVMIVGHLATPVETPLSEEEIAAFQGLTAYSPTTTVSNDANCWMWIQYLLESEMSPWFYPKTEIGLYYKAYAGYTSDYPVPTCRETKLIRKLLDANYQLDFTVTDRSSRTEKYLWDLINGTTTMLSNIPKSDTEKFLHMLLGGVVTEYPVIDCERNYWMSKCVEQ